MLNEVIDNLIWIVGAVVVTILITWKFHHKLPDKAWEAIDFLWIGVSLLVVSFSYVLWEKYESDKTAQKIQQLARIDYSTILMEIQRYKATCEEKYPNYSLCNIFEGILIDAVGHGVASQMTASAQLDWDVYGEDFTKLLEKLKPKICNTKQPDKCWTVISGRADIRRELNMVSGTSYTTIDYDKRVLKVYVLLSDGLLYRTLLLKLPKKPTKIGIDNFRLAVNTLYQAVKVAEGYYLRLKKEEDFRANQYIVWANNTVNPRTLAMVWVFVALLRLARSVRNFAK